MMTENEIRELLSDYLDGELDRATRLQVEEGLRRFPSTRKTLEQLSRTVNLISAMPRVAPPANMAAVIAEKARRQVTLTNSGRRMLAKRSRFVLWQRMGAAAAVLAAGCLAAFGVWRAQLQLTPAPQIVVFDSLPPVDPETVGSNPIAGRTERERAAMEAAVEEAVGGTSEGSEGAASAPSIGAPGTPVNEPSRDTDPQADPRAAGPQPAEAEKRTPETVPPTPFAEDAKGAVRNDSKKDAPGDRRNAADEKLASDLGKTGEAKTESKSRGNPDNPGFARPTAPTPAPKPAKVADTQSRDLDRLAEQRRLQQADKKVATSTGRNEPGRTEPGKTEAGKTEAGKTKDLGGIGRGKPVFVLNLGPATRTAAKVGEHKAGEKAGEAKPQNAVAQGGQANKGYGGKPGAGVGGSGVGGGRGIQWTSTRRNDRTQVERLREQLDGVQAANQAAAVANSANANSAPANAPAAPPQAVVQQVVEQAKQQADEQLQRQEAFAGILVVRGDEVKIRAGLREAMSGLEKRGVVRWAEQANGRLASFTLTTDDPADVDNVFRVLDLSPGITRVDLAPSAECVQVLADADADRRAKDGKETQFFARFRDGKADEKPTGQGAGGKAEEPKTADPKNAPKKIAEGTTVHPDGNLKAEGITVEKGDEPAAKLAGAVASDPQAPKLGIPAEAGKFKHVQEAARVVARRQNAVVASNLRVFQQRLLGDADQLRKATEAEAGDANRAGANKDQAAKPVPELLERQLEARPAITLIVTIQPAPAAK